MVPRGPWWYDGEIDLGFGGALRMAATIVTRDPDFGWFAYGGALAENGATLSVRPRDGLRRRLTVIVPDMYLPFPEDVRRLRLELERDGFAAERQITIDKALGTVTFIVENRTGAPHVTGLRLSYPVNATYRVVQDGTPVPVSQTGNWDYPWRAELSVGAGPVSVTIARTDR
jgi:hypothetical protein